MRVLLALVVAVLVASAAEPVAIVITGADAIAIAGEAAIGRTAAGERLRSLAGAGARAVRVRLADPVVDDAEVLTSWLKGLGFAEVVIAESPPAAPCGCLPEDARPARIEALPADLVP